MLSNIGTRRTAFADKDAGLSVLGRGVFQCCEHIGLFLLCKAKDGGIILHLALTCAASFQLTIGILPDEVLEVYHRHILAQQLDGLCEDLLAAVHILHTEHVDRVKQDLQVVAADLVQHGAGTLGVVDDVARHRLDGEGHAVLLCAAHNGLEGLDKGCQRGIGAALRAVFILDVWTARLRAHHTAAQQAGKADVA